MNTGKAVPSFFFKSYGVEHGITQGTVSAIFQDSEGFIWVGTQDGLQRFDGYQFELFTHIPEDSCSLKDNSVQMILEDDKKNLWILTSRAIHRMDLYTKKIKRYSMEDSEFCHSAIIRKNGDLLVGASKYIYLYDPDGDCFVNTNWSENTSIESNINSITEDSNLFLYISTRTTGIYLLDEQNSTLDLLSDAFLGQDTGQRYPISDGYMDRNNTLWLFSSTGLFKYMREEGTFFCYHTGNSPLSNNSVRCLLELDDEYLVIGTFSGLNLLNRYTNEIIPVDFEPEKAGELSHYSIHSLFKDYTGNLWVGTWKGLNLHSDYQKKIYTIRPKTFTGLIGKGVEDSEGNLWFGTEGAGLLQYNTQTGEQCTYPLHISSKRDYNRNIIKTVFLKDADLLYCTTIRGEVYQFSIRDKKYRLLYDFESNDIYSLYVDRNKNLWVPTNTGRGLVKIDKDGQMTDRFPVGNSFQRFMFVTSLVEIEEDIYLIGTLTQKIYVYNYQNRILKTLENEDLGLPSTQKSARITSVLKDKNNNYWISTYGNGLFVLNSSFSLIYSFYDKSPDLSDFVCGLLIDSKGSIWGNTPKEIFSIHPDHFAIEKITYPKDCRMEFSLYAPFLSLSTNTLYFPGNKGIVSYQPVETDRNIYPPQLRLTSLYINNHRQERIPGREIVLKSDETNIAIEYTALNYVRSDENQYSYMLEGVDDDWNDVRERRVAYYSNLSPGKYKFSLMGSNNDEIWNPYPTEFLIIVKPPLYRTWWAFLLYFIAFSLIAYKFIRDRIIENELKNNIRFKQMEKEKIGELHKEKMALFTNFSHELCHLLYYTTLSQK